MSSAIDPKSGTHFSGLKIFVSSHALDRAVEHFGIERSAAPVYVMDLLRKASLISPRVIDEGGKSGRMFAYRRTVYIVHPTEPTVFTLYPQFLACEDVRSPIERIIQRTIKAAERKEAREVRRINVCKAELFVERAQYELRRMKSDSTRIIAEMCDKIADIDARVTQFNRDILEVEREKTNTMKSVVAYV